LVTRQDPAKVIAFYRKRMIEDGLIVEGVLSAEPMEDDEFSADDDDDQDDDDEIEPELMAPMDEAYKEMRAAG
jgi:hypothetical protein